MASDQERLQQNAEECKPGKDELYYENDSKIGALYDQGRTEYDEVAAC